MVLHLNNKGEYMDERLIEEAKKAMKNAYAPYSKFNVGAAVLTKRGNIFSGCNIENATYGATNCGERTAIFKSVSEGECEIIKIAITSSGTGFTFPCGICRQVMAEFMTEDGEVILINDNGEKKVMSVKELLPFAFKLVCD